MLLPWPARCDSTPERTGSAAARTLAIRLLLHVQDSYSSGRWLLPIACLIGTAVASALVVVMLRDHFGGAAPAASQRAETTSQIAWLLKIERPDATLLLSAGSPLLHLDGISASSGGLVASGLEAAETAPASPHGQRFANVDDADRECLARAVYFEARGEPIGGQIAVAQVVLNRVASRRWPATICRVVNQGFERGAKCQFSFACWASSRRALNGELWEHARWIAEEVLAGNAWLDEMGAATHYHRHDLRPVWRLNLDVIGQVGAHIFYADRATAAAHSRVPVEAGPQVAAAGSPNAADAAALPSSPGPIASRLLAAGLADRTEVRRAPAQGQSSSAGGPVGRASGVPAPSKSAEPAAGATPWVGRALAQ